MQRNSNVRGNRRGGNRPRPDDRQKGEQQRRTGNKDPIDELYAKLTELTKAVNALRDSARRKGPKPEGQGAHTQWKASASQPKPAKRTPPKRELKPKYEQCGTCDGYVTSAISTKDGGMITACYKHKCLAETRYTPEQVKTMDAEYAARQRERESSATIKKTLASASSTESVASNAPSESKRQAKRMRQRERQKLRKAQSMPIINLGLPILPPKSEEFPGFLSCHCGKGVFICCTRCNEPLCEDHTDCTCPGAGNEPPKSPSLRGGNASYVTSSCQTDPEPVSEPTTPIGGRDFEVLLVRPPLGCKSCGDLTRLTTTGCQTDPDEALPITTTHLQPVKVFGYCERSKQRKEIEVLDAELYYYLAAKSMFSNKSASTISDLKGKAELWLDKNRPDYTTQERYEVIASCVLPSMIPRDAEENARRFLSNNDNMKRVVAAGDLMQGKVSARREFSLRGHFGFKKLTVVLPKTDIA